VIAESEDDKARRLQYEAGEKLHGSSDMNVVGTTFELRPSNTKASTFNANSKDISSEILIPFFREASKQTRGIIILDVGEEVYPEGNLANLLPSLREHGINFPKYFGKCLDFISKPIEEQLQMGQAEVGPSDNFATWSKNQVQEVQDFIAHSFKKPKLTDFYSPGNEFRNFRGNEYSNSSVSRYLGSLLSFEILEYLKNHVQLEYRYEEGYNSNVVVVQSYARDSFTPLEVFSKVLEYKSSTIHIPQVERIFDTKAADKSRGDAARKHAEEIREDRQVNKRGERGSKKVSAENAASLHSSHKS